MVLKGHLLQRADPDRGRFVRCCSKR
jgi:hypothetical protein